MTASESNEPTVPLSQARTASVPVEARPPRPMLAHLPAGAVVSRYRVESVLGEGGMGTVYLARQERPAREVALKVVRPGYATERMLKRFELEAEVLGRLLHPGIAQIYEAGVWTVEPPTGVGGSNDPTHPSHPPTSVGGSTQIPFFAMELVKGAPLTRYASEKKLGTRERLELIAKVCDAVQHAHQKGVIHRDLKPGNILVVDEAPSSHSVTPSLRHSVTSSVGQPKVLDFGVARATDSDLQQTSMETDVGAIIGTIPYMSPEQVGGDPAELDTRSDVYALGVIAYELLVGRLPYDLERKMIHEAARIIREEEPTRLSSIDRAMRGDVETIVGHALEKDKARRYGAASALAADIRRYLSDEPIAARPASTWYQVAKFSQRNKALVVGVAATFVALVGGLVGTGYGLSEARVQRDDALAARAAEKERADQLKQVSDFQASMLDQVDPITAGVWLTEDVTKRLDAAMVREGVSDENTRAARIAAFRDEWRRVSATDTARRFIDRTILKPAGVAIDKQFSGQPLVDAQLRQALADRYSAIGMYGAAAPLQSAALEIRRRELGDDDVSTGYSTAAMGLLLKSQGKLADAEPYLREEVVRTRRVHGDDHVRTIKSIANLGYLLEAKGNVDEAEALLREALEKCRRLLGEDHETTLNTSTKLAGLLYSNDRFAEAEPLFRDSLERQRRIRGSEHADTLNAIGNLGGVLYAQGRIAEAEPYFREALDKERQMLGDEHPKTLVSLNNMGALLGSLGDFTGSEAHYRQANRMFRLTLGPDHPNTIVSMNNVGNSLREQNRFAEAEPCYAEAFAASKRVLGPEHRNTLSCLYSLAKVQAAQGKLLEAEEHYRELIGGCRRIFGDDNARTLESCRAFIDVLVKRGRHEEASLLIETSVESHRRRFGADGENTRHSIEQAISNYSAWHAQEPGKGYDAKAAEWKANLDAISAPTPAPK